MAKSAVNAHRHVSAEVKQRWSVIGWLAKNLLFRAPCFGRHVKPLVPDSKDINRLMIIMMKEMDVSDVLFLILQRFGFGFCNVV
jgi:hypothetical protein